MYCFHTSFLGTKCSLLHKVLKNINILNTFKTDISSIFVTSLKSVKRMGWLVVTLLVLSPGLEVLGDQTCEEAMAVMDACNTRSLDQYTKDADTLESYEDFARKTCTMINTIYDCIVTLSKDCPRAEKPYLDGMGPRMDSMGEGNPAWDINKCPGALALKNTKPALDCEAAIEEMHSCQEDAAEDATITNMAGDGRPDYAERKACNWVTQHYQHCMVKLVENRCFTMDELHQMFDEDYTSFMAEIVEALPDFDRRKCPITSESLTSWNSSPRTTTRSPPGAPTTPHTPSGATSWMTGSLVVSFTSLLYILTQ